MRLVPPWWDAIIVGLWLTISTWADKRIARSIREQHMAAAAPVPVRSLRALGCLCVAYIVLVIDFVRFAYAGYAFWFSGTASSSGSGSVSSAAMSLQPDLFSWERYGANVNLLLIHSVGAKGVACLMHARWLLRLLPAV